jgi:hypothetical protein
MSDPLQPNTTPQDSERIQQLAAIPYTTVLPSDPAPWDGYRTIYNDGTDNWMYTYYAATGWLAQKQGVSQAVDTNVLTATNLDNIAVGDAVSYLVGGVNKVVHSETYATNTSYYLEVSNDGGATPKRGVGFCPAVPLSDWTITVKLMRGSPAGSPNGSGYLRLYSDSAGAPNFGNQIASHTIDIQNDLNNGDYASIVLTGTSALAKGSRYWLVVESTDSAGWRMRWAYENAASSSYYAYNTGFKVWFEVKEAAVTTGVYRTIEEANDLSMGTTCVIGVASAVNSGAGTVNVLTQGVLTNTGAYTQGSRYYVNAAFTDTGGIGTSSSGHQLIGYALTNNCLYVYPIPTTRP